MLASCASPAYREASLSPSRHARSLPVKPPGMQGLATRLPTASARFLQPRLASCCTACLPSFPQPPNPSQASSIYTAYPHSFHNSSNLSFSWLSLSARPSTCSRDQSITFTFAYAFCLVTLPSTFAFAHAYSPLTLQSTFVFLTCLSHLSLSNPTTTSAHCLNLNRLCACEDHCCLQVF